MATAKATAKPTITSLKRDVARLTEENAKLARVLAEKESNRDMWYKSAQEYQAEINAVHDLLDVLPNTIHRKKEDTYSEHKLMTRLASFLANRNQ